MDSIQRNYLGACAAGGSENSKALHKTTQASQLLLIQQAK